MDIADKVYGYLSTQSILTAKVSTRIYPNVATDISNDDDYVIFSIVSDVPEYTLDGNTQQSEKRLQISVWSKKYLNAHTIKAIIDGLIDNWTMADKTIVNTKVINSVDRYEKETMLHGVISDYIIFC